MEFGIMFFSSAGGSTAARSKYRLLLEIAERADQYGFASLWTPERHFHEFGGLFPNPAVLGAALAVVTRSIQIRAGSVISPLHHAVRIAEEWSVVDNLSGGRVAVSFGSGWNVDDFIFYPERYKYRQAVMYEQIETVRRLWRGEELMVENSFGKPTAISIYPLPVQKELPVWITSSGNVETFVSAGIHGANVLTHLIGQDLGGLAAKIARYREALRAHHGPHCAGKVTLMLHTFLGEDEQEVRDRVRAPFREYIRSAVSLERLAAEGQGAISGGHQVEAHKISPATLEDLLDITFERYFERASLMGTPTGREPMVWCLQEIGVDEIACLVDFIDDRDAVLHSLGHLDRLRQSFASAAVAGEVFLESFLENLE